MPCGGCLKARQGAPRTASRRGRSADGHDSPHQRRFGRNTNLPPLLSSSRTRASRSQYSRGAKILLQGRPRTSPRQLLPPISPEVQLNFPKLPAIQSEKMDAKSIQKKEFCSCLKRRLREFARTISALFRTTFT